MDGHESTHDTSILNTPTKDFTLTISPGNKSRYGRVHKPKIIEDFYNIDDILVDTKVRRSKTSKSPIKSPTKVKIPPKKQIEKPQESPIKKTKTPPKPTRKKYVPPVLHVTADSEEEETETKTGKLNGLDPLNPDVQSAKATKTPVSIKERKFFKSPTQGLKMQNMTKLYLQKSEPIVYINQMSLSNLKQLQTQKKISESINLEKTQPFTNIEVEEKSPIDVTKVLKIVANNPDSPASESKSAKSVIKTSIKTYSNKRKSYQKPDVIESFGLPDEPIIPVKDVKKTVIKRNAAIDVEQNTTIPENVNIDASLYKAPWLENNSEGNTNNKETVDQNITNNISENKPVTESITSTRKGRTKNTSKKSPKQKCSPKQTRSKRQSLSPSKKLNLSNDSIIVEKKFSLRGRRGKSVPPVVTEAETTIEIKKEVIDDYVNPVQDSYYSPKRPRLERKSSKSPKKIELETITNTSVNKSFFKIPKGRGRKSKSRLGRQSLPNLPTLVSEGSKTIAPIIKRGRGRRRKSSLEVSLLQTNDFKPIDVDAPTSDLNQVMPIPVNMIKTEPPDADEFVENNEIKEESYAENKLNITIKKEEIEYEEGDLVWAKIGSHPYWPAMVAVDPDNEFRKRSVGAYMHTLIHVRFFGDRGRRSWVNASTGLMPFVGVDDLIKCREKFTPKNKKSKAYHCLIVPAVALEKWQWAADEAESLRNKPLQEKLDFFNVFIEHNKKVNKKRKALSLPLKIEIKQEPLENAPVKIEKVKSRKSLHKPPKFILKEPRRTRSLSAMKLKDNIEKNSEEKSLEDKPIKKGKRTKSVGASLLNTSSTTPKIKKNTSTEPLIHESIKAKQKLDSVSMASDSSSDSEVNFISVPDKIPVFTMEDQISLFKRNTLFRGISKDKVCQVCETPKGVIKCKGRCNGLYHISCAMKLSENNETNTECDTNKDRSELDLKNDFASLKDEECLSSGKMTPTSETLEEKKLSLGEQIDLKMKEIMEQLEKENIYADSTTDYTSSDEPSEEAGPSQKFIQHVTADHVSFGLQKISNKENNEAKIFKCANCVGEIDPPCFVCHKDISRKGSNIRQKCSIHHCGKFYHPECLKPWPQTQWSLISTTKHKESDKQLDTFVCPMHYCHICISDDPRAAMSRLSSDKLVKCLRCPATYHVQNYCIPAGSQILTASQIICPRHLGETKNKKVKVKKSKTANTAWCHICNKGGNIVCCETCPTSIHSECLDVNLLDDGTFMCEDCETGRYPLYDEVVWVKCGKYRWWPSLILFPNEVPDNVNNVKHEVGEFVVKFFGTNDHAWVGRGRVFLFQEGDKGHSRHVKKKVDAEFQKAVNDAAKVYALKKEFKAKKEAEYKNNGVKPPSYIRIKVNKPVGNVRQFDGNVSNTAPCGCDPHQPDPCGPDTNCLNRLLLTECDPDVCPAGENCNNQHFEKRLYPPLEPYRTAGRGWGLKTLAPLSKGQFVIEYVGELIDEQEYQRRITKMHEQKEENYYFLTIDKDRMIDAGPKGNVARFMNHSCQPNCETQKWTVKGDTRVGLFALNDIPAESELTFNYNLECAGNGKKICQCGAPKCSGFIGLKTKQDELPKKPKRILKKMRMKKRKSSVMPQIIPPVISEPCFICGEPNDTYACQNKICTKVYHLKCVNLDSWPEGKWVCPWHNCNICSKRTIRCCVKCTNAYCPVHSEGNVRYDKLLGFVCNEHDPININTTIEIQNPKLLIRNESQSPTKETDVTSTTSDEIEQTLQQKNNKCSPECSSQTSAVDNTVTSTPSKDNRESSISPKNLSNFSENKLTEKRKRGRPRKVDVARKRMKLHQNDSPSEPLEKSSPTPKPQNIYMSSYNSTEIILSSTVPTRHLRVAKNSADESHSLLKRHREYEKDLPIRKRSTLRCETLM